jgi:ElaB/YqjD/DUF883 family membrane-anchored ribosome-binding protein
MTSSNDSYGSFPSAKIEGAAHAAKANVTAAATAAGEQLADVAAQAQHVATEQLDNLSASIRRHPFQATGIAVGIGFLLATIARR